MSKFILCKGDYIDLRGMSVGERKEIQSWMEDQDNVFYTTKSSFTKDTDFLECVIDGEIAKTSYLSRLASANRTEELKEAMKKDKMKELPEEFIIVNADNMAVRQWLKDLGYKWCDGLDLTNSNVDEPVLAYFKGSKGIQYSPLEFYKREYPNIPVITPKIEVTGFDIEQPNHNQSEIERMKKNIEELKASIKKLEGKR